jgi:hypothetical protein
MKALTLFVSLFLLVRIPQSIGQTIYLNGGFSLPTMKSNWNRISIDKDFTFKIGFVVGAEASFDLTEHLKFNTGLNFLLKGYNKFRNYGLDRKYELKTNLLYFDVPWLVGFEHELGKIRILAELGPYLGVGLFGKYNTLDLIEDDEIKRKDKVPWGNDESDYLKRTDYGMQAGLKIKMKRIGVGISYQHGLKNLGTFGEFSGELKNRLILVNWLLPISNL